MFNATLTGYELHIVQSVAFGLTRREKATKIYVSGRFEVERAMLGGKDMPNRVISILVELLNGANKAMEAGAKLEQLREAIPFYSFEYEGLEFRLIRLSRGNGDFTAMFSVKTASSGNTLERLDETTVFKALNIWCDLVNRFLARLLVIFTSPTLVELIANNSQVTCETEG